MVTLKGGDQRARPHGARDRRALRPAHGHRVGEGRAKPGPLHRPGSPRDRSLQGSAHRDRPLRDAVGPRRSARGGWEGPRRGAGRGDAYRQRPCAALQELRGGHPAQAGSSGADRRRRTPRRHSRGGARLRLRRRPRHRDDDPRLGAAHEGRLPDHHREGRAHLPRRRDHRAGVRHPGHRRLRGRHQAPRPPFKRSRAPAPRATSPWSSMASTPSRSSGPRSTRRSSSRPRSSSTSGSPPRRSPTAASPWTASDSLASSSS